MSNVDFPGDFSDILHAKSRLQRITLLPWGDQLYRSIEAVLLTDFFLDALALAGALHPTRRLNIFRIALSAAFGAILTGIAAIYSLTPVHMVCVALASAPGIVFIASGPSSPGELAASAVLYALICSFIALVSRYSGSFWPGICVAACAASAAAARAFARRCEQLDSWEAEITLFHADREAAFRALIDTGNMLREPVSSLPIMVVHRSLVENLLPVAFDPAEPLDTLPSGWRIAAFGGLGGSGRIACFMPDVIMADGKRLQRSIWVGVFDGELPGRYNALAPPAIIHTTQSGRRTK